MSTISLFFQFWRRARSPRSSLEQLFNLVSSQRKRSLEKITITKKTKDNNSKSLNGSNLNNYSTEMFQVGKGSVCPEKYLGNQFWPDQVLKGFCSFQATTRKCFGGVGNDWQWWWWRFCRMKAERYLSLQCLGVLLAQQYYWGSYYRKHQNVSLTSKPNYRRRSC